MNEKTNKPHKEYGEALKGYKDKIKNNKYARELELAYHKTRHKHIRLPDLINKPKKSPIHRWPVDNLIFNKVLYGKLDRSLSPKHKGRKSVISPHPPQSIQPRHHKSKSFGGSNIDQFLSKNIHGLTLHPFN